MGDVDGRGRRGDWGELEAGGELRLGFEEDGALRVGEELLACGDVDERGLGFGDVLGFYAKGGKGKRDGEGERRKDFMRSPC